jgi:hypothetical protein
MGERKEEKYRKVAEKRKGMLKRYKDVRRSKKKKQNKKRRISNTVVENNDLLWKVVRAQFESGVCYF